MSDMDKTTENSKVELTDDELDSVQGGYTASDGVHKGGTPRQQVKNVAGHEVDGFCSTVGNKQEPYLKVASDLKIRGSEEDFQKR